MDPIVRPLRHQTRGTDDGIGRSGALEPLEVSFFVVGLLHRGPLPKSRRPWDRRIHHNGIATQDVVRHARAMVLQGVRWSEDLTAETRTPNGVSHDSARRVVLYRSGLVRDLEDGVDIA